MEKIYQGGEFSVPILSANAVDSVVFYSLSTQHKEHASITEGSTTDGMTLYTVSLSADQTKAMPVGIYNLEVIRAGEGGEPIMDYYKKDYAEVVESSLSQRG